MIKKVSLFLLLAASTSVAYSDSTVGISFSREVSDIGDINSFNIYSQFTFPNSDLGYQLGTGLSAAEITDFDGYVDNYTAWEGNARFGFFSDISFYIEAGIDIGELLVLDEHHDHYHSGYYDDHNEVDNYVGVGFGVSQEHFDIRIFSRYRYIDGFDLYDNQDVFTGAEFAIHF